MDTTLLLLSVLFGILGFGIFTYGKNAGRVLPMGTGMALMTVPYFISNAIVLLIVCIALLAAPLALRDL